MVSQQKVIQIAFAILVIVCLFPGCSGERKPVEMNISKDRVQNARDNKWSQISKSLEGMNIPPTELEVLIIAYKDEALLRLFARKKKDEKFSVLKEYEICESSGLAGPKRKQGDKQVPEGFYFINRFNPNSDYHLSLGINYPNESDLIKTTAEDPGGDIFIHGGCVTIGCLPITDDKIEELYLFALTASENGQSRIPVYIFPFEMNKNNFERFKINYSDQIALLKFWNNLKEGYDLFEQKKTDLNYSVDIAGKYDFN